MAVSREQFMSQLSPEERSGYLRLPPDVQNNILININGGSVDVNASSKKPSTGDAIKQEVINQGTDYAKKKGMEYLERQLTSQSAAQGAGQVGGQGAGGAAAASGSTPGFAVGQASYAGYAGAANDLWGAYKTLNDDNLTGEQKSTRAQQQIALAGADYFTGGLTGMAEGFLRGNKTTGKYLGKMDKLDQKYNPITRVSKGFLGSATKGEEMLRKQLGKNGIVVPNIDVKEWENNEAFKESREESDLTGKDIIHAGQFYSNIQGYDKFDAARQEAIANEALKRGLIRERKGMVELSKDEDFLKYASGEIPTEPVATTSTQSAPRVDDRKQKADAKKDRQRATLNRLVNFTPTVAPDYSVAPNQSLLLKNPYL